MEASEKSPESCLYQTLQLAQQLAATRARARAALLYDGSVSRAVDEDQNVIWSKQHLAKPSLGGVDL